MIRFSRVGFVIFLLVIGGAWVGHVQTQTPAAHPWNDHDRVVEEGAVLDKTLTQEQKDCAYLAVVAAYPNMAAADAAASHPSDALRLELAKCGVGLP